MDKQAKAGHTPGLNTFSCKACGWSGLVSGRPRCLACYRRRAAAWRASNPEKNLALKRRMDKKLRAERPGVAAAKKRAKRARNPSHYRAKWAERAAWLRGGDVTREQLAAIYTAANGACAYCRTTVGNPRFSPSDPRGFDHRTARANGGRHTADNIVVCCGSCNERKSDNE